MFSCGGQDLGYLPSYRVIVRLTQTEVSAGPPLNGSGHTAHDTIQASHVFSVLVIGIFSLLVSFLSVVARLSDHDGPGCPVEF